MGMKSNAVPGGGFFKTVPMKETVSEDELIKRYAALGLRCNSDQR